MKNIMLGELNLSGHGPIRMAPLTLIIGDAGRVWSYPGISRLPSVTYLGPLRSQPSHTYRWFGDPVENVGARGERAIAAILEATAAGRRIGRGPDQWQYRFDIFIAGWLKELGLAYSFDVCNVWENEYEVVLRTHEQAPELHLKDVGFGVSYVLPALVQAFYASPHSTVWITHPEVHLPPRVQTNLADVFISAVQSYESGRPRGVQLVIESHSELLLLRLQRRVAEGVIKPDDVAIHFVRDGGDKPLVEELKLDIFGEIKNWPEEYFGDDLGEITARIKAGRIRIHDEDMKIGLNVSIRARP